LFKHFVSKSGFSILFSILPAAILTISSPRAAHAVLNIVSVSPAFHSTAQVTDVIQVHFDRAVKASSINASTFRVFCRWSGAMTGTFTFSNGNQTVTFTPSRAYSAGETVWINLSHDIQALDTSFLRSAGYAWSFGTAVAPSAREFQQVDVMSNRIDDIQTRIYGASASDLNEDGYLDLATINEVSADVRVFLNRADGSGLFHDFLTPQAIGEEASPNEPADFNNDGHSDLCIGATNANSVWVLLGAGDGTFSSIQEIPVGTAPHGVAPLDVDGDGDMDIVNANFVSNNLSLLINNGNGVFAFGVFFDSGADGEWGLVQGDMNRDGITDVVVGGENGHDLRTLLCNGNGTFTPAGPVQDCGGASWMVVVDDVNGDGILDAASANAFSQNVGVMLGNANGTFGSPNLVSVGAHTPSCELGDLDGDGDADLVLSSFGGGFWRVYTNNGAGNFTFDVQIDAPASPSCAVLYDSDNDGDLDLALSDEIADVVVLMENGGPTDTMVPGSSLMSLQNYPDPFQGTTRLHFNAPASVANLTVFDSTGRRVVRRQIQGPTFLFDGRDDSGGALSPGVYFYRVDADEWHATDRMIVIR
jgi:hypothetical protein